MAQVFAQLRNALENWNPALWITVPIFVGFINFGAMVLSGGGHAPSAFFLPVLVLEGPVSLVFMLLPWEDMYFRERWGEVVNISALVGPSLLYLLYLVLLRLCPPTIRWRVLQVLVSVHVLWGVGYLLYRN